MMNILNTITSYARTFLINLGLFLILAMCTSCTDESSTSNTDISPLDGAELEEARSIFQGHFALRVQSTTEQELPVVGLARSTSYTYKLLIISEAEGIFSAAEKFCTIRMETEGPAAPSVPMALVNSIPTFTAPLKISQQEGIWQWERVRSGLVLGAELDDPLNDLLPSEENDGRVYDQDMDGYPGVTLNISGLIEGEIYAVIRYVDTISGSVTADGIWEGITRDETEQIVIGASQDILKINVTPVAIDDPSLNTSTAIPITAEAGCNEVIETIDLHFSTN